MDDIFNKALVTGFERVAAWADLLDGINVYPVADGDTGRNLTVSLSPLRFPGKERKDIIKALLFAARGNSGNIAARFFSGFLAAESMEALTDAAENGRNAAWEAVSKPRKGTMLSVFDALSETLRKKTFEADEKSVSELLDHLENAVHATVAQLARLKKANVVDAGALGMFIYFEGFFNALAGTGKYRPIMKIFKNKLAVSNAFHEKPEAGYCVDLILKADSNSEEAVKKAQSDKSAVIIRENDFIKIHIHTDDKLGARDKFESFGLVKWADDDLCAQILDFNSAHKKQAIHIMSDAAGSLTHKDVKDLGITLLDSYITAESACAPETYFDHNELYKSMLSGVKASTSQASDFERFQHYESVLSRHKRALYLCVGSVYTGNYRTAMDWKNKNDKENRLTVIDTGTASGKLGLIVIAAARYAREVSSPESVIKFAEKAIAFADEFIFLEKLHYLAAGGRMSRTGAFFGDMLHVKPIVSPHSDGAAKIGIARNNKDQLEFLFRKLESALKHDARALIMLEYTDNPGWVENKLKTEIKNKFPNAEILVQPLSLTTGVHTGPGTWAVAYLDIDAIKTNSRI
ncbi:MAG: DegV family protein [Spirochaetota bacterium]